MVDIENVSANDIINESQMPMIIGLTPLEIQKASELVVNNQGSFIMVSNQT